MWMLLKKHSGFKRTSKKINCLGRVVPAVWLVTDHL